MTASGHGFVAILNIDGKPAAAQAFLQTDTTLLLLYSGFDLKWAKYSPLFILQSEALKRAANAGIYRFDLLTGKAHWQKRWAANIEGQIEKVVQLKLTPASIIRTFSFAFVRQTKIFCLRSTLVRRLRCASKLRELRSVYESE